MPFINSVSSKVFRRKRPAFTGLLDGSRGTADNPGISAQEIYAAGNTASGWYHIQTSSMGAAQQVYCNMDDQSGGWMLVSYNPTAAIGTPGMLYPNIWTGGQGTLNKLAVNVMNLWYHDGVAQCDRVMKMATTVESQPPQLEHMQIANYVVYDNPDNLNLSVVNPTVITNNTAMTGTWYPIIGHTQMAGPLTVNAPGDWIYTAGSWWTVCGPSTDLQPGGRSGNAQGTGSWTNPTNNNYYGLADVTAATTSLRTDLHSYAFYIK